MTPKQKAREDLFFDTRNRLDDNVHKLLGRIRYYLSLDAFGLAIRALGNYEASVAALVSLQDARERTIFIRNSQEFISEILKSLPPNWEMYGKREIPPDIDSAESYLWYMTGHISSNPATEHEREDELFPTVILEYPYPERYNPEEELPGEPEEEEEEEAEERKFEVDISFMEPQVPKNIIEGIQILSSYFEVPLPTLKVKRGRGRGSMYSRSRREIRFGAHDLEERPSGAMLHEFAHHLVGMRYPNELTGHGINFCIALKDVIEAWGVDYGKAQTLEYKRVGDYLATQGISVKTVTKASQPSAYKIHPWIYTGSKVIADAPDIGKWTATILSTRGHIRAKVRLETKLGEATRPTSVTRLAVPGTVLLVGFARIFEKRM